MGRVSDLFAVVYAESDAWARWVRDNPGEWQRWRSYAESILAGETPDPPAMRTRYGRLLVAAGELALAARRGEVARKPLRHPASCHIWGGNEQAKAAHCDVVIASTSAQLDPRLARAANPGLIALTQLALDPFHPDWRQRKGFAWTYGGGLSSWRGGRDDLDPHPQGEIRAFAPTDNGCRQADGLQGFALHRTETSELIARLALYAAKLGRLAERGYDGIWSDNLFPGNLLRAGWAYGSCGATIDPAAWDRGIVSICRYLAERLGPIYLGGNVVYRATDPELRASTSIALREGLEIVMRQGPDAVWADIGAAYAWAQAGSESGLPKILLANHLVAKDDTAGQRVGLALALVYGAAYCAYSGSHTETYWPAEIEPRGRLGLPVEPPRREGTAVFARRYERGEVRVDLASRTAVIP